MIFGTLSLLAPFLIGSSIIKENVFQVMKDKPGGMGEMTMWPYLKEQLGSELTVEKKHDECPDRLMGSFRWWWTAQLSIQYPDYKVLNLDTKSSYYSFRDRGLLSQLKGCQIVLVGQKKHYYLKTISKQIKILSSRGVSIPFHADRESVLLKGVIL